jgi:metallophosphoesterase (TIGR00282 family)
VKRPADAGSIRALVLGDIVGKPGCRALFLGLSTLKERTKADIVIANGENASEGRGITPGEMEKLFGSGVDVITSGNHIWQKKEILPFLQNEDRLLRPENYPQEVEGKGSCLVPIRGASVAVVNLQGRMHLSNLRCPFKVGSDLAARLRKKTKIIIVDFHAEATEEKEALAIYLDGKVSALVGTHTHVQTADERILPKGTGYITDIGMIGPTASVIGMNAETAVRRSLTQIPLRLEVVDRTAEINGVLLDIGETTGKTISISRIKELSKL